MCKISDPIQNSLGIQPKQPLRLQYTTRYNKHNVMKYGISHFYSFVYIEDMNCGIFDVPDGCIDIIFCCDEVNPFSLVLGTASEPRMISKSYANRLQNRRCFGVRFLLIEAPIFPKISPCELVNHYFEYSEVMESPYLFDTIVHTTDFNHQIQVFMAAYFEHYVRRKYTVKDTVKNYLASRIFESAGNITINQLSKEMSRSVRYLDRVFLEKTGLTPKQFCSFTRVQYVINVLTGTPCNLERINYAWAAETAGYFDQSHMIKCFEHVTSLSPTHYVKILNDTKYWDKLNVLKI
jgi:AraC-like DNA-binding protein